MKILIQSILVCLAVIIHSSIPVSASNCSTKASACLNGATCVDMKSSYSCLCKKGFTGKNCDIALQPARKQTQKKCPKLRITDGIVNYFRRGIMARFQCNKGYSLNGPRAKICRKGVWYTRYISTCRPNKKVKKSCSYSKVIHRGTARALKHDQTMTEVLYRCDSKYTLIGSAIRKCSNGNWDSPLEPYCVKAKKCKKPKKPRHGNMFGGTFKAGSLVRFFCNVGYDIKGSNQSKCMMNGKWDQPVPKCIKIDPLRDLKNAANSLRRHFINKLELLTTDSRARSGLSSGAAGLDLVFIFDSSASVGEENFKKGIEFAKTIITEFGVSNSTSGTRVAVVVFSTTAEVIFNLKSKRIFDQAAAINRLKNLKLQGGGTATALALDKVINEIVPEVRNNSKKALFLITDGMSNTGGTPSRPSKLLRDGFFFEIYAIGVTSKVNEKELRDIASEPFRTHVYLLKDFKSLQTLKELITKPRGSKYSDCGDAGDTQLRDDKAPVARRLEAKEGAWPWLVAIYVSDRFRCSGVLLAKNWVLTVAHCLENDAKVEPSEVLVVLGEHDRTFVEGSEQYIRASRIRKHRRASNTTLDFDLVLIKLQNHAKLTAYVRTICMPIDTDRIVIRPNGFGIVAGWGSAQNANGRPAFKVLMQSRLQYITQSACQRDVPFKVNKKMTCVADPHGNKDDCTGDIGSPIMVYRPHRSDWALAGFALRDSGCPYMGNPGVFSNLLTRDYQKWIKRLTKRKKSNG